MPFSRRLTLAIFSILMLTLITNGLAQPVYAQTTTVTANVNWVNGSSPRPDIALQLYRKTSAMTEVAPVPDGLRVLLEDVTQVSWTNLELTDINDLPYEFSVKELHYDTTQGKFVDGPPTNYAVLITYTADRLSVFVTFTYTSNLIDVTATKIWSGGTAPRPTIAFRLYRATATTAKQPMPDALIKDNTVIGTVTWIGLEANDINANPYIYSVVEGTWNANRTIFTEGPPPDYQVAYSTNGLTVTNTFLVVEPKVTAYKEWVNGPATRPMIWFKLYRQISEGTVEPATEAPLKELPSGTTDVTWNNITLKNPSNQPYTFSVREVDAQGQPFVPTNYTKSEVGLTVTNTHVIPKNAKATATKVWVNGPAEKPSTWFKLYRNISGGAEQEVPLTEAPVKVVPSSAPLNVAWTGLEATDIAGNPFTFFVKEGTWNATTETFTEGYPTNYTSSTSTDKLTITNSYVSPKFNVKGTKIWSGGPAAKPNIQIQLYRNGALMGSPFTLTSGITSYTWSSVNQTDQNGATYQYTVDEVTVPAYYSKRVNGMTITNTYTGTLPYTGDNTHNASWLALLLGVSALLPLISWVDLKLLTRRKG